MRYNVILVAGLSVALSTAAIGGTVAPTDVAYDEDGAVSVSLTGTAGDAANGAKIYGNKKLGNCVACHQVTESGALYPGNVGPSLDGAGSRWEEAQLRGIVSNAKKTFEDTVMPSFYKTTGYIRPGKAYTGKAAEEPLTPLLDGQQIEDLVAYLGTLKDN